MIRLPWALLLAVAVAGSGQAQLTVSGELGWQGLAVPGAVNPLAATVTNGGGVPFAGELVVWQRIGSGWRGQAERELRVPVLLAPGGRARLRLPWPVEPGLRTVELRVEADGHTAARAEVPVRLAGERIAAAVGPPPTPAPPGPLVVLNPDDLPDDPLFLTPFATVYLAPAASLAPKAGEALAAWAAFLGGRIVGRDAPPTVHTLSPDDLSAILRGHRARRPPLAALALATVAYLVALGYALPALARGERAWPLAAVASVALGFALIYLNLVGMPETQISVQLSIQRSDIARFNMDWLAVGDRRGGVWRGEGMWVEVLPGGGDWAGREVAWTWGPDGPQTTLSIAPGQVRFLWRLSPAAEFTGVALTVRDGGLVRADGEPMAMAELALAHRRLLGAVDPLLADGDRVVLASGVDRAPGRAAYVYRLRWEGP
ncbi:MAG: hypothetical protein NUV94_07350 [Candidatus Acetothermia bacterium]|jgi:hypothetical protein|nr:hypothetical protein [Candidatus Acetothermia bacterium]